jgi:hypothetical protein
MGRRQEVALSTVPPSLSSKHRTSHRPICGRRFIVLLSPAAHRHPFRSNSDLIDLYAAVRTHPRMLTKRLVHYHYAHSESFFYKIRASKPSDPLKKAAWLLYLNRTCWNGLFRVNLRGEFNVPIGTKKKVFVSIADDNTSVAISYLSGFSKYDGRDCMAPLQVDTCCLSGIKIADSSQAL